jgi:hypothetical protein
MHREITFVAAVAMSIAAAIGNAWAIGCAVGEPTPINCTGQVLQVPIYAPQPPRYNNLPIPMPSYVPPVNSNSAARPFPVITPGGNTAIIYPSYPAGGPSGTCVMESNGNGGFLLRC